MLYIFPYVSALVFWVIFFGLINASQYIVWFITALCTAYMITIIYIGRGSLRKHWNLWLNVFLYLLSSFGLVLIMNSRFVLNFFIVASGLISGLLIHIILQYFRNEESFVSRRYLEFVNFIYLIAFWQVAILVYFGIVAYDMPIFSALSFLIPTSYVLARGIVSSHHIGENAQKQVLIVTLVTEAEIAFALELLPFHYVVSATVLTIWFFYTLELMNLSRELSNRRKKFKLYTILAVTLMVIAIVTSQFK